MLFIILNNFSFFWLIVIAFFLIIQLFSFKHFFLTLFFCLIVFLIKIYLFDNFSKIKPIEDVFVVESKLGSGYIIKINGESIFLNSKQELLENFSYKLNSNATLLTNSDFHFYLKSKKIFYEIKTEFIEKNQVINNLKLTIKDYINDASDFYKIYMNALILGNKSSIDSNIIEKIYSLNIIQLFVVSGLHFNVIFYALSKVLKFLKIRNHFTIFLVFSLMFFYLYILNFNISSLRAFFSILLIYINKIFLKNKVPKIKIHTFIMFLFFSFNFYIIYSISFIFSFSIVYIIYLNQYLKFKKRSWKYFWNIISLSFISILFNLFLNDSFNLFGIFYNFIISPFVIGLFLLSFILMPFKFLLNNIFEIFDQMLTIFNSTSFFLKFHLDRHLIISFYFILYLCILFMVMRISWSGTKLKNL